MKIQDSWDVTPCPAVNNYRRFRSNNLLWQRQQIFTSQQRITSLNTAIFHVVKNMLDNSVSSTEAAGNYPPLLDNPFTL
jgi:hypothetical protein